MISKSIICVCFALLVIVSQILISESTFIRASAVGCGCNRPGGVTHDVGGHGRGHGHGHGNGGSSSSSENGHGHRRGNRGSSSSSENGRGHGHSSSKEHGHKNGKFFGRKGGHVIVKKLRDGKPCH